MQEQTRTDQIAKLEASVRAAVAKRERIRKNYAEASVRALQAERDLRAQLRDAVRAARRERPSRAMAAGGVDPRAQAGRYADVARGVFEDADGPLSQVEIGRRGEIGTGTLTHAIRALELDGVIEPTGEFEGRSRVYRLKKKAKVTRRAPGSGR